MPSNPLDFLRNHLAPDIVQQHSAAVLLFFESVSGVTSLPFVIWSIYHPAGTNSLPAWMHDWELFHIVNPTALSGEPTPLPTNSSSPEVVRAVEELYCTTCEDLDDPCDTWVNAMQTCRTIALIYMATDVDGTTPIRKAAASVSFVLQGNLAAITYISVAKPIQNGGFATMLLLYLFAMLRQRMQDYPSLMLRAHKHRHANAIAFFRRRNLLPYGVAPVGTIPHHIGHLFLTHETNLRLCYQPFPEPEEAVWLRLKLFINIEIGHTGDTPCPLMQPQFIPESSFQQCLDPSLDNACCVWVGGNDMTMPDVVSRCVKGLFVFDQPVFAAHSDLIQNMDIPAQPVRLSWRDRVLLRPRQTLPVSIMSFVVQCLCRHNKRAILWEQHATLVPPIILQHAFVMLDLFRQYMIAQQHLHQSHTEAAKAAFHPQIDNQRFMQHTYAVVQYILQTPNLLTKPNVVTITQDIKDNWSCVVVVNPNQIGTPRRNPPQAKEPVCGFIHFDPCAESDMFCSASIHPANPTMFLLTLAYHVFHDDLEGNFTMPSRETLMSINLKRMIHDIAHFHSIFRRIKNVFGPPILADDATWFSGNQQCVQLRLPQMFPLLRCNGLENHYQSGVLSLLFLIDWSQTLSDKPLLWLGANNVKFRQPVDDVWHFAIPQVLKFGHFTRHILNLKRPQLVPAVITLCFNSIVVLCDRMMHCTSLAKCVPTEHPVYKRHLSNSTLNAVLDIAAMLPNDAIIPDIAMVNGWRPASSNRSALSLSEATVPLLINFAAPANDSGGNKSGSYDGNNRVRSHTTNSEHSNIDNADNKSNSDGDISKQHRSGSEQANHDIDGSKSNAADPMCRDEDCTNLEDADNFKVNDDDIGCKGDSKRHSTGKDDNCGGFGNADNSTGDEDDNCGDKDDNESNPSDSDNSHNSGAPSSADSVSSSSSSGECHEETSSSSNDGDFSRAEDDNAEERITSDEDNLDEDDVVVDFSRAENNNDEERITSDEDNLDDDDVVVALDIPLVTAAPPLKRKRLRSVTPRLNKRLANAQQAEAAVQREAAELRRIKLSMPNADCCANDDCCLPGGSRELLPDEFKTGRLPMCFGCKLHAHVICMKRRAKQFYCLPCYAHHVLENAAVSRPRVRPPSVSAGLPIPKQMTKRNELPWAIPNRRWRMNRVIALQMDAGNFMKWTELKAMVIAQNRKNTLANTQWRHWTEEQKRKHKQERAHVQAARQEWLKCYRELEKHFLRSTPSFIPAIRYDAATQRYVGQAEWKQDVMQEDGTTKFVTQQREVHLTRSFVQASFKRKVCNYVRHASMLSQGQFFPVPKAVPFGLDQRIVSHVKFVEIADAENQCGYHVRFDNGEMQPMKTKSLRRMFGSHFLDIVRRYASRGFINIPPGNAMQRQSAPVLSLRGAGVVVQCQQGQLNTCVFSSFASALCGIGMSGIGILVEKAGKSNVDNPTALRELACFMCAHFWLQPIKIKNANGFDLLNADLKEKLAVVVLKASDGSTNHAVTVHDSMIFDSNEPTALPLCRENLDFLCSSSTQLAKCTGIMSGYIYQEQGNKHRLGASKRSMPSNPWNM